MIKVRGLLVDRRRRQRGSVLSGLLIIIALLSILIGALMTEVTSSFLLSRTLVTRVTREATVTSAMELAISGLQKRVQNRSVPPNCAKDSGAPVFLSLNGSPAAVNQISCIAIVPEATSLAQGAFSFDGTHDTTSGTDRYLIVDASGRLYSYPFGQTTPSWSTTIGGPPTAPLLRLEGSRRGVLLIPAAIAGPDCGSHCVALFNDGGGTAGFRCSMPASTTVTSTPAGEVDSSPNFPDYAFFAGSGASGRLYVYDASANGSCDQLASAALGGVAAAPLVFSGTASGNRNNSTVSDEIFVLVTSGTNTNLQHWRYREATCNGGGNCNGGNNGTTISLNLVTTLALTGAVGGNALGYAASAAAPTTGTPLSLVVASASGKLAIVQIAVRSGPAYTMSSVAAGAVAGSVSREPYWCKCPGQDLIGVGSTNGSLYVLNSALSLRHSYDGAADARPAINSTPIADANGDWYFGADDGYVYDVEVKTSAPGSPLFKAARFGPGGKIRSSPVVASCTSGPCLYFASSTAGSYFALVGHTRVIELRACVSTASNSPTCAANPRLWARVEVGSPAVVGAKGVLVQGWSYYSP